MSKNELKNGLALINDAAGKPWAALASEILQKLGVKQIKGGKGFKVGRAYADRN